jgi:hypothetical protein
VLAAARQVLSRLGRKDATAVSVAESADTGRILAASPLNGDGVITPDATTDAALVQLIKDMVGTVGGTADRTGTMGVTAAQVDRFFADLAAYVAWSEQGVSPEVLSLGGATAGAHAATEAVRAKVEDFFGRCLLAAFDPRALGALNRSESEYLAVAAKDLKITADEVAGFPLAAVAAGRTLPLADGVNPAWAARIAAFRDAAVIPLFGAGKSALTEVEWATLTGKLAAYGAWASAKAGAAVEPLGLPRARAILASDGKARLADLLAEDAKLAPELQALGDLERLVRLNRDLRALLHNFVNFADFYSRDKWAVFQAGTLFLDSRSTELCLRVDGPNALAAMSKTYIAYCSCTRPGGKSMTIAACFTQGDSDFLFVGRHGVFYDRAGTDWDRSASGRRFGPRTRSSSASSRSRWPSAPPPPRPRPPASSPPPRRRPPTPTRPRRSRRRRSMSARSPPSVSPSARSAAPSAPSPPGWPSSPSGSSRSWSSASCSSSRCPRWPSPGSSSASAPSARSSRATAGR